MMSIDYMDNATGIMNAAATARCNGNAEAGIERYHNHQHQQQHLHRQRHRNVADDCSENDDDDDDAYHSGAAAHNALMDTPLLLSEVRA